MIILIIFYYFLYFANFFIMDAEFGNKDANRARFILDSDLCYSLDKNSYNVLSKLLGTSEATMQVINSNLSKINFSLLQNTEIHKSGNKIHEYKPNTKARWWIYLSSAFMIVFFVFFTFDAYVLRSRVLAVIGLLFMIAGLIIQFLLICKNGKVFKPKAIEKNYVHDNQKLEIIKKHMISILAERNARLCQYQLELVLGNDASYIELIQKF